MRIPIAEDQLILAYAMRAQLPRKGMDVVGVATNGSAAVAERPSGPRADEDQRPN